MKKREVLMAVLLGGALALPRAEAVEITGSVSGTIKDQSGAVLPGATVTVRGGRLPAEGQSVSSSPSGDYRVSLLPPGSYTVEATLPSFAAQVRKAVEVAIDADTRVDFVLRPSGREESIDVVAEPPVVDTRRSEGGVTNIVTRSGSNDWRASAFLFGRNDALDASNVDAQEAPKLERYQWGGTLGGPLRRDKAFFFGAFEKLDEKRGVNIDRAKIPAFVASGAATPGGREDFSIAPKTDRWNGMLKLDLNLGPRQRLLLQGNRSDEDDAGEISSPVLGTTALPSAASGITGTANSGIVRHTAVLTGSTFLESSL